MQKSVFDSDRFLPFTNEQMDLMKRKYESGETSEVIANEFGIDPNTVRRRLKLMGVPIRTRGKKPMFSDDDCLQMLHRKSSQSLTIKMLAEKHGCSDRVICDALLRGRNLANNRA